MLNKNIPHTLDEIANDLRQHTRNPMLFRIEQYMNYNGVLLSEDWSGLNRRRIDFQNCRFLECNLTQTGFAGSSFTGCIFENCTFENTNLSQCSFVDCIFKSNVKSIDFSKSKFVNTQFLDFTYNNMILSDSYMSNVIFQNTNLISASWEFCHLSSVTFNNSTFSKLNFEYAIFGDVHCIDTLLPFQSIPFIFGGPQYVLSTSDNVYFKSQIREKLSLQEYKQYMEEMLEFYKLTNNIFPLANLLLSYGNSSEGYDVIKRGIVELSEMGKLRTLCYLVYLFNSTTVIPFNKKPHLYQELFEVIHKINISKDIDRFDKNLYLNQIRSTLLFTENGGYICSIKTNVDSSDSTKVHALYDTLESVVNCFDNISHNIQLSHNSDMFIELVIACTPAIITSITQIITLIINKTKNKSNANNVEINISINELDIPKNKLNQLNNCIRQLIALDIDITALTTEITTKFASSGASNIPKQ